MLPPAYDVSRALDEGRWSPYQKLLVGLTALTVIFDGIDNQLLGIAIPAFMHEWARLVLRSPRLCRSALRE